MSVATDDELEDAQMGQTTYECLDEARAWVDAAWDGFARWLDMGLLDQSALFATDCVRLIGHLEVAGALPSEAPLSTAVELTPQTCLERAAAALARVSPDERPVGLLLAWADLRALMLRVSEFSAPDSRR